MKPKDKCAICDHERRFHANKSNHELGTSHCTKAECDCKEFVEK